MPTHLPTKYTTTIQTDPCLSNPCQRGVCSVYLDTYKCTCDHGVFGRNCEQGTCKMVVLNFCKKTNVHALIWRVNLIQSV